MKNARLVICTRKWHGCFNAGMAEITSMKTLTGLVVAALLLTAAPAVAQTAESQPRYTWVATACDTWGCAIAAMASANGDRNVVVLPTKSAAHPWVVLKRMEAGVVDGVIDPIFDLECFRELFDASARFASIDREKIPLLVTTTDGSMLVVCLHATEPKRRVVRQ
jgi:hypothetical protein